MTVAEAIHIIHCSIRRTRGKYEETEAALSIATKAMEKQIPRKPLNKTAEYNGDYGECPCCKRSVSDYDNAKRCPDCGQALDWKD